MVRPLDLGIFLPNAKGGGIMATGFAVVVQSVVLWHPEQSPETSCGLVLDVRGQRLVRQSLGT